MEALAAMGMLLGAMRITMISTKETDARGTVRHGDLALGVRSDRAGTSSGFLCCSGAAFPWAMVR